MAARPSKKLPLLLYRTLLQNARRFDKHRAIKAVIPHPLPLAYMVLLGGRDRDFFGKDSSCVQAVREGFKANAHLDATKAQTRTVVNLGLELMVRRCFTL